MKIGITGASHFVNRMYEACGQYQWAREILRNSLEASATRVEFGLEWQAVERLGVYRRVIADDGIGMDASELERFFSHLGAGAKVIGGIHDNFGVGAKIASLPWNPEGFVVISYKEGLAAMIWIVLDPESGDYELMDFEIRGQKTCVIDPTAVDWEKGEKPIDWGAVAPDWVKAHGTVVVLLGSDAFPDTVLGNPAAGEASIKGISVYLNSRFWDLSDKEVHVVELRSEKKNSWPTGPADKDDSRRPNRRRIMGARHYVEDVEAGKGKLGGSGYVLLDEERVQTEWYLWEGERPAVDSYARKSGYVAIRYKGELYQLTTHKAHFRWFGIVEGQVQQNLSLILEPQLYGVRGSTWGIHPDQSRNRLIFTGNGEKGVDLPLADWGREFAESIPDAVLAAIRAARGKEGGTIEDEEYRKRLQDKFGDRWKVRVFVKPRRKREVVNPGTETEQVAEVSEEVSIEATPEPSDLILPRRRRRKTQMQLAPKVRPGGDGAYVEREVRVDVPRYRFGAKDEFERPWHLALWAENDPEGPTVVINKESPILEEIIRYHQERYADHLADEVSKEVMQVFGEVAACKVAHSQKLTTMITAQEVDNEFRTEQSLTIALMGLLAEESLIAQRLGRLGKKTAA